VEVRVFGPVELVDEGAAAAVDALGRRQAARRHLAAATEIRRTGTTCVGRPGVEQCLALLESEAAGGKLSESG
jgi:hypothetical protein